MLNDLTPQIIKKMSIAELKELAEEIRSFLLSEIPKTGGHLSSNLGVVELTIALHYVFESPTDQLIFDVGHQSYVHKIITGRASSFKSLRQMDGLSGYASYDESKHDVWESGHAGTSISAMIGALYAKKIKKEPGVVVAVIGDASIANGVAFEAINNLGTNKLIKGIVVLNDNEMGISESVGSFTRTFSKMRGSGFVRKSQSGIKKIVPKFIRRFLSRVKRGIKGFFQRSNIFEDLGFAYIGPVDGHNIKNLIKNLEAAKKSHKSIVLHVVTTKGKGHEMAELDRDGYFHGIPKGHPTTAISYSRVISDEITKMHQKNPIFVVMPAMSIGSEFVDFSQKHPDYFLDVGIAEEHAAAMAASLAKNGQRVFLPIYSTFSQRAFDQILNDIARPNLHVVIGIDRAGIVGEDGSTHQGLFDLSMFNLMPNMTILAPSSESETRLLLNYAYEELSGPVVIRYPRESIIESSEIDYPMSIKWPRETIGDKMNIISFGPVVKKIKNIIEKNNWSINLYNARVIKPLCPKTMEEIARSNLPTLIYEETTSIGGLGSEIVFFLQKNHFNAPVNVMSITDKVVPHGDRKEILKELNMDESAIIKQIIEMIGD